MSVSRILSRLRYKGQITEEEYRKMMDIKNSERHIQKVYKEIRAEIEAIEINGQVDEHTMFIRTGEQIKNMVLEIIDKHTKAEMESKK